MGLFDWDLMQIYIVMNRDLLNKDSEVIVNSVGPEVEFGGFIAKAILKKWGKTIEKQAKKAAKARYGKVA